jgi:hypothetical protein
MAIYKNAANQKIAVFAWDTSANAEKTGDAANITARISKDGAAVAQTNDVNPTELDATYAPGIYLFDMTQAETDAELIVLFAKSSTANIKLEPIVIYTLPIVATAASISALNNLSAAQVNAEVVDVMRTDTIPDSYSADGAQPTIVQALLEIRQFLTEKSVSGLTVTVNKPDGTTSVMTFTLDNATTPTSITRAT